VTEHSFKVLEVNSNSDIYLYQFIEPLLSDRRLRQFYQQFTTGRAAEYFMK